MPQANIYLDEEEDKIIHFWSEKWKINKHETIKRIIKEKKIVKGGSNVNI